MTQKVYILIRDNGDKISPAGVSPIPLPECFQDDPRLMGQPKCIIYGGAYFICSTNTLANPYWMELAPLTVKATVFFPTDTPWSVAAQWLDERGRYQVWNGRTGLHCDTIEGKMRWQSNFKA